MKLTSSHRPPPRIDIVMGSSARCGTGWVSMICPGVAVVVCGKRRGNSGKQRKKQKPGGGESKMRKRCVSNRTAGAGPLEVIWSAKALDAIAKAAHGWLASQDKRWDNPKACLDDVFRCTGR